MTTVSTDEFQARIAFLNKMRADGELSEEDWALAKRQYILSSGPAVSTSDLGTRFVQAQEEAVLTQNDPNHGKAKVLQSKLSQRTDKYGPDDGSPKRTKAIEALLSTFAKLADKGTLDPYQSVILSACMYGDIPAQLLIADLHINPPPEALQLYNTYVMNQLIAKFPEENFKSYQWSYVGLKYPLFPAVKELVDANNTLLADHRSFERPESPNGGALFPSKDDDSLPDVFAEKGHRKPTIFGGAYWVPVQQTKEGPAVDLQELKDLGEFTQTIDDNMSKYAEFNDVRIGKLEDMITKSGIADDKGKPILDMLRHMKSRAGNTKKEIATLREKMNNMEWLQSILAQSHGVRRPPRSSRNRKSGF